jgi:hypothetical protein
VLAQGSLDAVTERLNKRTELLTRWRSAHEHEPRTRLYAETDRELAIDLPAEQGTVASPVKEGA